MTDPYGALTKQRKGDMGYFNGSQWTESSNGHSDPFGSVPATGVQFFFGTLETPISTPGSSFKVVRVEKFDTTVGTFQPDGNAAIYGGTYSQVGNKGQPNAVGGIAYGYAEGGAYVIGGFFSAIQASGGVVNGGWGGSLGVYAASNGHVNLAAIQGHAVDVRNNTTLDGDGAGQQAGMDMSVGSSGVYTSAVTVTSATPAVITWTNHGLVTGNIVHFDTSGSLPTGITASTNYYITVVTANTFKISTTYDNMQSSVYVATSSTGSSVSATYFGRFGNGIQLRAVYGGGVAIFKALANGGDWLTGIDLSEATWASGTTYRIKLATDWGWFSDGTNMVHVVDASDFMDYNRSANTYYYYVGNTVIAQFVGGTPGANNTAAYFLEGAGPTLRQLKTFDPGAAGINFTAGQLVCVLV